MLDKIIVAISYVPLCPLVYLRIFFVSFSLVYGV